MARIRVSTRIADKLIWASDRTCNLCHKERFHVEIHHMNGNPGDGRYDNLILLCRNCHSAATARGLGRKLSPGQLMRYKRFWEGVVRRRRSELSSGDAELEEALLRTGAERLVKAFETYMVKRDAPGVLSLFTPPRTDKERGWLETYILAGDLGKPGRFIRLFATRGFGYKVLKYDISSVKVINPRRAEVAVEEWRTWWSDGEWDAVPRRCKTHLTLAKVGNEWFVDKYREPSSQHGRHKYGGLGG